ncbi:protein translocase subunit SecD [Fimbriiglobus ruber]|uniref:Multifunctional fusion protein n=1 Tax=Fimbriiglobus ruber TaxID=1908690 RepID=A0A225E3P7_9BACT|nr:protein translocase subunit SecD [Fimbriiglobus ruber]OWK45418.1 Protein-export membrane protein SecF [Fimbriiglobus ruber]
MRRNFLVGLLICLIPTALAGVLVGQGFYRETHDQVGFRRGIDLAGGTILVYEVNLDKPLSKLKGPGEDVEEEKTGLSSDDIKKLAENLKRRIDPNDMKNVVVRPVGRSRIEIILPFAGSTGGGKEGTTENEVQDVKSLVRQVGVLEFRILANPTDDGDGIRDARKLIDDAKISPTAKADLEARAKAGLPPPAPEQTYTVEVNKQIQDGVRYEWAELGPEERDTLGVSNAFEKDSPPPRGGKPRAWMYQDLKSTRGGVYPPIAGQSRELFYSRDFIKENPAKDEEGKKVEYFVLTRVSAVDSLRVDRDAGLTATADNQDLKPVVRFGFSGSGATRFTRLTERNRPTESFQRQMAILMDGKVVSAPNLQSALHGGGIITGSFDMPAVNRLVHILRSGALNAELKPDPVSENTVGPTLGQDTIHKGLIAIGLSFAAVLGFMVVYYRFAGLVACVALFVNLLITVGFMELTSAAFTLPGLAGIVLMLGMAVDANVLIYERIREEREKGATLASAIRNGYDRAFPTIIDTHLTSIFTAIVLYAFGNDNLKGFSVSLTVGLIISLFTALYVTRLMFDFWLYKKWITQLRMHQLFARPRIDFMKIRHLMFALTAGLTVAGLGLFLARGEAGLNVDFTKGTAYGGRLKEGQERGLTAAGGKLGLLDLLGEARQRERLEVKDAVWLTKPKQDDDPNATVRLAEYIYKIVYADGTEATVTLANKPDGATEEAQIADLKKRASELPGLSIEQVFLAGVDDHLPSGQSRSFTARTTEKEPDLVQVGLDRLLRDETTGEQLLATTRVTNQQVDGPVAVLTLDKPASPGYLKGFLVRELDLINRVPATGNAPTVEVTGVKSEDQKTATDENRSGRYSKVKVDVSKNPEFKALADAAAAKKPAPTDEAAFKGALGRAITAFEARPIPDRLETFDPALAADTRNKALYAILASWLAILAYLWFRFGNWTFGAAAVLCLVHDLCFTLGMIAVCHYLHDLPVFGTIFKLQDFKIDLAAVAALLTLVGYSVNDTIVVFDRIREVRGKSPVLTAQMINDSVNGTLSRTVLASLTVFLVVGVLYLFGGEGVHLFSFVMVVGVIVGTYSSIYIASPLLLIFGEGTPKTGDRHPGSSTTAQAAVAAQAPGEETLG